MHFDIVSKLGVTVKDTGFSINELVVRMQELFNQRAFPELLCEILMMFDEMLKLLVMRKCPIPFSCGCGGDSFIPGVNGPKPVQVFADGTKCKGVGDDGPKGHGHAKQGDVKVLLGIRESGTVFPIGAWAGHETWKEIGDELERRKVRFPEGSVLVCDGEAFSRTYRAIAWNTAWIAVCL